MRTLLLTLTTCLFVTSAQAKYSGGSGTAQDPYQIATAADLIALGETPADYDKHFVLTADIDLDPKLPGRKVFDKAVIAPVRIVSPGRGTYPYPSGPSLMGVFDGNGHTISHLTITGEGCLGLFGGLASGAEVKNLGVVEVNITGWGGGLVGISGWRGLDGGTVGRCYSAGTISGGGGLVGHNSGYVTNCYSTCSVRGSGGGLVGDNDGFVIHCYSTGAVGGGGGGLVEWTDSGTVTACFWDILTSRQAKSAGGAGKTTPQMQDIRTYADAGWDFADQIQDGTSETWQMPEGGGYPALAIFSTYTPPKLQGVGTAEDPYRISNAVEFGAMVYYRLNAHYRLAASIDLLGIRWGTAPVPRFAGTFDGSGLTISHLTIKGESYLGLFGQLEPGAEVRNLGVADVNITGSADYVGGLAGFSYGNVSRCYSAGAVNGQEDVGGLVGHNVTWNQSGGSVTQCYSTVMVAGNSRVGGLIGSNQGIILRDCYSDGSVTGVWGVGGLVGWNHGAAAVRHCYSAGAVSGGLGVGGLVGNSYYHGAYQCFWDIQTSGQTTSAGGTGKTTMEMQTAKTFLDAGWDFVGETANGTEDIWWILEGKDYPRLWRKLGDAASP